jgi:hypothetical protein
MYGGKEHVFHVQRIALELYARISSESRNRTDLLFGSFNDFALCDSQCERQASKGFDGGRSFALL